MASTPSGWLDDVETKPAPGALRRIQSLVNTVELPAGPDRLADPADARRWLVEQRLLSEAAELTAADLTLIRSVREGLRALLVQNSGGGEPSHADLSAWRGVLAVTRARADLGADGRVYLSVPGGGVANGLLELALIVRDAQHDGSWARLKACANDDCRWAFYDRSRNHGGTWCDMSTCGNRLKNRDFRARRRASG